MNDEDLRYGHVYRICSIVQLFLAVAVICMPANRSGETLLLCCGACMLGSAWTKMFPAKGFFLMHNIVEPWRTNSSPDRK